MVLTVAETTIVFQDANHMSIPNATRISMQKEGITVAEDLYDFTDENLKQITENLRSPNPSPWQDS